MAGENAILLSFTDRNYTAFDVTLAGIKTKGDIDVIGNNVGFYLEDGVSGNLRAFIIGAQKVTFPKEVGVVMAAGDDLFFNDVTKEVNKNTAYRPCGVCMKAAASGATTVNMSFHQEAAGTY